MTADAQASPTPTSFVVIHFNLAIDATLMQAPERNAHLLKTDKRLREARFYVWRTEMPVSRLNDAQNDMEFPLSFGYIRDGSDWVTYGTFGQPAHYVASGDAAHVDDALNVLAECGMSVRDSMSTRDSKIVRSTRSTLQRLLD